MSSEDKVSKEDREYVRFDLVSLGNLLRKKYGLKTVEIRKYLQEMLTVSV